MSGAEDFSKHEDYSCQRLLLLPKFGDVLCHGEEANQGRWHCCCPKTHGNVQLKQISFCMSIHVSGQEIHADGLARTESTQLVCMNIRL
jgi:hypothetical protein